MASAVAKRPEIISGGLKRLCQFMQQSGGLIGWRFVGHRFVFQFG